MPIDPQTEHTTMAEGSARLKQRGSNQVGMRQFNERVVLQALRAHGATPKAELARLTGLTAQTIGLITARLDEDGLLVRQAPVRGRVGQPSVPLGLNPDGAFSIGIKIGRRSADWLLVDFTGRVRQRLVLEAGAEPVAGDIGTTIFHPVGTAKMGRADDPMAVVDANVKVAVIAVVAASRAAGSPMPPANFTSKTRFP